MKFLELTLDCNEERKISVKLDSITAVEEEKYCTIVYFDGNYVEVKENKKWIMQMLEIYYNPKYKM